MGFGDWTAQERDRLKRFVDDMAKLVPILDWDHREAEKESTLLRLNELNEGWWDHAGYEERLADARIVRAISENIRDGHLSTYATSRTRLVLATLGRLLLWPVGFFLVPIIGFFVGPIVWLEENVAREGFAVHLFVFVTSPLWIALWAVACALALVLSALATVASLFYLPFVELPRKLKLRQAIEAFRQKYTDAVIGRCHELVAAAEARDQQERWPRHEVAAQVEEVARARQAEGHLEQPVEGDPRAAALNRLARFIADQHGGHIPVQLVAPYAHLAQLLPVVAAARRVRPAPVVAAVALMEESDSKNAALSAGGLTVEDIEGYRDSFKAALEGAGLPEGEFKEEMKRLDECVGFFVAAERNETTGDVDKVMQTCPLTLEPYTSLASPYYIAVAASENATLSARYKVCEKGELNRYWLTPGNRHLDPTNTARVTRHGNGFPPEIEVFLKDVHAWKSQEQQAAAQTAVAVHGVEGQPSAPSSARWGSR